MNPEERRLLEETAASVKENNTLLKKVHRSLVVSRTIKIVYWTIIIGVAIGAFYFLQPYVDSIQEAYDDIRGGISELQNGTEGFRNLFGGGDTTTVQE